MKGIPYFTGLHGEAPGLVRRQKEYKKMHGSEPLLWFLQKGMHRAREASLSKFRIE